MLKYLNVKKTVVKSKINVFLNSFICCDNLVCFLNLFCRNAKDEIWCYGDLLSFVDVNFHLFLYII